MKKPDPEVHEITGFCCVCGHGYCFPYGRWGDTGTCSKACEAIKEQEVNNHFPGTSAEDFKWSRP